MEAKDKGATLISVDPRFTRTSAQADIYAPMRSGADIAFLGGMINYILQNDLVHRDYVRLYTNATFLVNEDFKMPGELDGVFSGYDAGQAQVRQDRLGLPDRRRRRPPRRTRRCRTRTASTSC